MQAPNRTPLQALRARKGLRIRQIAEATGYDKSSISLIERGLTNPRDGAIDALASAYGVSEGYWRRLFRKGKSAGRHPEEDSTGEAQRTSASAR